MKNVLRTARAKRTVTLISFTTTAVLVAAGAASGAYSGMTGSGEILTCFKPSSGAVRVVDHLPCKKGEQALRWNSRGRAGQQGAAGASGAVGQRGVEGQAGEPGPAGAAGRDGKDAPVARDGKDGAAGVAGAKGQDGAAGVAGAAGITGEAGAAGNDGARGADGATGAAGAAGPAGPSGPAGPAGPQGAQGPAGPAGSAASSSGMQLGQVTNNSDPDCAMVGPVGRTAGAACSFGAIQAVGEYLPASSVVSGFRVLLDRNVNAQVDIIARTLDPSSGAPVDAFVLCSVAAGSNTCAQGGERTLTGPNLFALQMSGDRSWTKARFGYSLVQA